MRPYVLGRFKERGVEGRNICVPEVSCAGVHWNSVARCGVPWRGLLHARVWKGWEFLY
jgi:hypothetical protein